MKNILLVLVPTFLAYAGFIGAIVCEIIKKPKYFVLKTISFVGCIVLLSVFAFPLYKDMARKTTYTVEAEYVDYQASNTIPGSFKAYFEGDAGRFHVYIPVYTRDITKLEAGKTYEIEYFRQSRIIKEYKLIE